MLKKYIGTKEFYKNILAIGVPLALSNLLNSCMSIVDGIMVSSIGMVTAVGNARNIITINDMVTWGVISGIAVFASQFYGAKQKDNLARTFGLCLLSTLACSLLCIIVIFTMGERILMFYLNDVEVCKYSLIYLRIFSISLIPNAIGFSLATMYRAVHKTKLTFIVSGIYSALNCVFNYFFIYIMNLGIAGAAYGTLLTMVLDALTYYIIMLKTKPDFYADIKTTFDIKKEFVIPVFERSLPILFNETIFGFGQTLFNKAFGILGTGAMEAFYVSNEIYNIFNFIIWGYGSAVSIVVGTTLGEGNIEKAKEESKYQLALSLMIGLVFGLISFILSPALIQLYHVNDPLIYKWTKGVLAALALKIVVRTMNYMMFSTLKAGGDSKILNILDSGIMYLVGVPLAFVSVKVMALTIVGAAFIIQIEQFVRCLFTIKRYNTCIWAQNLTELV